MRYNFKAEIKRQIDIDGAYVEIPFDVEQIFGSKRVKVKAWFDGKQYRGSIVKMGGLYILGITKAIRNEIGKNPGDIVTVEIERDQEERVVEIPNDFLDALKLNKEAFDFFETLSYTHKKDYINWITSAKKENTRNSRILKAIEMLKECKKLK